MAIAGSIDFSAGARTPATGSAALERNVIDRLPILAGLSSEARSALLLESSVRHHARKSTLFGEGSVPTHVCIVLSGRVRAVKRSETGREVILETFEPGAVLVDALAAPDRKLVNDWETSELTDILLIPPPAFAAHLSSTSSTALTIMNQMLGRIESSKQLAAGLALTDVPDRVVAALKDLAVRQGHASPDGVIIPNRPTQQELANSIGACRETVSRVVSDLTRKGLMAPRGRSLMLTHRLLSASGN
jgi:CRP/FNR family cyclic AMP-dependent transcriptional regulator